MFESIFPFIDPIVNPIVELSEGNSSFVIPVEIFLELMEKAGIDRTVSVLEGATIEFPIDIALSLLKPAELEKLQKYVAFYSAKHGSNEI